MIRIGFVQDFMRDNKDEQGYAVHELEDRIGGEYEVVWAGEESAMTAIPEVDLLLVDYGGLHNAYSAAWDRYGRSVRRWADEHPGKPVVLWTAFTVACYKATFDEFDREAGNVLARYADAWDWDGFPDIWERLRGWLGVPADAPRHISMDREVAEAGPLVIPEDEQ